MPNFANHDNKIARTSQDMEGGTPMRLAPGDPNLLSVSKSDMLDEARLPTGNPNRGIASSLPRLIFLHVPKTAGTTIDRIFRNYYDPDKICPERLDGIRFWSGEQIRQYQFFSMHDSYQNLQHVAPPWQMLTVLREPIDRLLSHYLYWRSYRDEVINRNNIHLLRLAKLYSLGDFLKLPVPALLPEIDNLTTRLLSGKYFNAQGMPWRDDQEMLEAALANLERIDFCGIYEYLPESVDLACRTFDLAPPREVMWTNITRENYAADPQNFEALDTLEIDEETEQLLALRTRLDTVVYDTARARFLSQIGERPRAFDRFHHTVGRRIEHYARTSIHGDVGEPGYLLFGPYTRLRKGAYRATFHLGFGQPESQPAEDTPIAEVDIISGGGAHLHATRTLTAGDLKPGDYNPVELPFHLGLTATDLEFRVRHTGAVALAVESRVLLDEVR